LVGQWTFYRPQGQIEWVGSVNEKNGYWEHYYNNGRIESKGTFLGLGAEIELDRDRLGDIRGYLGEKDGLWQYYYESGHLKSKGTYNSGATVGYWENYYENGQLEEAGSYGAAMARVGRWREYYDNGQLKREGNYKDNKLPLMWDEDRAGYIEGFRFGDQVGLWNEYYQSGQLKTRESFWEGKLTGISEAFKEDGELSARVCYKAGEVVAISVCN